MWWEHYNVDFRCNIVSNSRIMALLHCSCKIVWVCGHESYSWYWLKLPEIWSVYLIRTNEKCHIDEKERERDSQAILHVYTLIKLYDFVNVLCMGLCDWQPNWSVYAIHVRSFNTTGSWTLFSFARLVRSVSSCSSSHCYQMQSNRDMYLCACAWVFACAWDVTSVRRQIICKIISY